MPVRSPKERVYYYECSYGKFRLTHFIPYDKLEKLVKESEIDKQVLEDLGIIRVERDENRKSNRYFLNLDTYIDGIMTTNGLPTVYQRLSQGKGSITEIPPSIREIPPQYQRDTTLVSQRYTNNTNNNTKEKTLSNNTNSDSEKNLKSGSVFDGIKDRIHNEGLDIKKL